MENENGLEVQNTEVTEERMETTPVNGVTAEAKTEITPVNGMTTEVKTETTPVSGATEMRPEVNSVNETAQVKPVVNTTNGAMAQQTNVDNSVNPYSQGNVYGQGIYMGNNFATQQAVNNNAVNQEQSQMMAGSAVTEVKAKEKKNKKNKQKGGSRVKKFATLVGSAAVFGMIAGGIMIGMNYTYNRMQDKNVAQVQIPTVTTTTTDAGMQATKPETSTGYADVAEEVMPSIVSITNKSVQTVRSWFQSYEQEVSGSGSGIIIGKNDDEILIATNNHVIDGAKELTVAFSDKTAVSATVKGADSLADLAVVSVKIADMDEDTLSSIRVAAIGSSDDLRVGESVIAIGNALGYGQSLTAGYISALDREVEMEDKNMRLLQTDAAINPGNSGGALLNTKGELIGINTVKFVDSTVEGMGYAIPISTAIPIINDLMNKQVIKEEEQGYLGIQGNDITDEYAASFNMPKGVYVVKIVENSPADTSGLKAGDIITKFAGRDVSTMEGLQSILTGKKAGEEIEMVVQRNNEKGEYEEVTIKVKLGAKKDMPESAKEKSTKEEKVQPEPEEESPGSGEERYYEDPGSLFDEYNYFNDFFRY